MWPRMKYISVMEFPGGKIKALFGRQNQYLNKYW